VSDGLDDFVQLDRTFHDLALNEDEGKAAEVFSLMRRNKPLRWPELLEEPRVVLLSEAGSGKSEEVRHVCRDLRAGKNHAFFLRIEHVVRDFEASFEEGTPEEFQAWIASDAAAWLLLDSVDEARLKDAKDFELAIRKVGVKLRGALQRIRIVITGRTDAWRPKTDLLICATSLPWTAPDSAPTNQQESDEAVTTRNVAVGTRRKSPFRVVALDDLRGEQIDRFATAKGVTDIKAFRKEIDRADASSFTGRPLDLAETVEFWNTNQRISSRLDLMRASIDKRLEERDQDRVSILRQLPIAEDYGRGLFEEIRRELSEKVPAWSELNRTLFWHSIAEERARRMRINGDRLTDYWHASIFGAYWAFDASDFDDMCLQIVERPLTNDKLVVLTLAFTLYQRTGPRGRGESA
jgi:hypothetical protein